MDLFIFFLFEALYMRPRANSAVALLARECFWVCLWAIGSLKESALRVIGNWIFRVHVLKVGYRLSDPFEDEYMRTVFAMWCKLEWFWQ